MIHYFAVNANGAPAGIFKRIKNHHFETLKLTVN